MAITAYGFDGSMSELGWAALATMVGNTYPAVLTSTAFVVTSAGSGNRPVSVGPGRAFAHGVVADNDGTVQLNAAAVTVGTIRYDTVALRFDWTANTVTPVIVTGGTTQVLAAGLNNSPGVTYDMPLAIITVNALSPVAVGVSDRRNWGGKTITVASASALPPVASSIPGSLGVVVGTGSIQPAQIYVHTGTAWKSVFEAAGQWLSLPLASGMTNRGPTPVYNRIGGIVYVQGGVQRSNGNILSSPSLDTVTVGTLPAGYRPGRTVQFSCAAEFYSDSAGTDSANTRVQVLVDGTIQVESIAGNHYTFLVFQFPAEA